MSRAILAKATLTAASSAACVSSASSARTRARSPVMYCSRSTWGVIVIWIGSPRCGWWAGFPGSGGQPDFCLGRAARCQSGVRLGATRSLRGGYFVHQSAITIMSVTSPSISRLLARTALPHVAIEVGVLQRELVAMNAMGFDRIACRGRQTAACVHSGRDGFEMIGIHATTDSAEMIKFEPSRNGPAERPVAKDVRHSTGASLGRTPAIAVIEQN